MPLQFINIVSTKRSGHHAFVQWLQEHSIFPLHFLNNYRLGESLTDVLRRCPDGAHSFVMNYEGTTFAGVASMIDQQKAMGASVKTIIFIRDPLNVAASLIKRKPLPKLHSVMIIRQVFAEHRLLALCRPGHNESPVAHTPFPIDHIVFYNAWLTAPEHRSAVADAFSLSASQLPEDVSGYGGGSSYDNKSKYFHDDTARLLSRWRESRSDSMFLATVTHPRLAPLFLEALDGQILDSFGGSFLDQECAAFLREAILRNENPKLLSAFISQLLDREDLFAEIEHAGALRKKPLIAKASLAGLRGMFTSFRE